jgi:hypothetical protein
LAGATIGAFAGSGLVLAKAALARIAVDRHGASRQMLALMRSDEQAPAQPAGRTKEDQQQGRPAHGEATIAPVVEVMAGDAAARGVRHGAAVPSKPGVA